jgi:SAM-dependent methyltransferase
MTFRAPDALCSTEEQPVARPVRAFISANKRLCHAIEPHLPQTKLEIEGHFDRTVGGYLNLLPAGAVAMDFGSGKECRFARYRSSGADVRIVGVDISERELAQNHDVDEKRVVDGTAGLPFDAEEVDLVASRFVLEHLVNTERFVADCARVLKPGGYSFHLFASKFALSSILNDVLPPRVSDSLLDLFIPECSGVIGFEAHYDRTYPSGIASLLRRHGLEVLDVEVNYYQSHYYSFFFPLYAVSVVYELILQAAHLENLAAKGMIVARKQSASATAAAG